MEFTPAEQDAKEKAALERAEQDIYIPKAPAEAGSPEEPEAEQTSQTEEGSGVPPMPEDGRDKFYNAETGEYNWMAHAREAEYNANRKSQKADAPEGEEKQPERAGDKTLFDKAAKEFVDSGEFTESTEKALADAGLLDVAQQFVETTKLAQKFHRQAAESIVGGPEEYKALVEWASKNLSDSDLDSTNEKLASPDEWAGELTRLNSMRAESLGLSSKEPERVSGDAPKDTTVRAFSSSQEMVRAIQDPRYKYDAHYRKSVEDRMRRS